MSRLSLAEQESKTNTWFGLKLGPSTFDIFDTFEDEDGRNAHLNGKIAEALNAKAGELLAGPPQIEKADLPAVKMP